MGALYNLFNEWTRSVARSKLRERW